MKTYFNLISSLERTLPKVNFTDPDFSEKLEKGVFQSAKTLKILREKTQEKKFKNKEEEITFFKKIKPRVVGKVIFYLNLDNIRKQIPVQSTKNIKKYFCRQIVDLNEYLLEHEEFYQYWKRNKTHRDEEYFLRHQNFIIWHNELLHPLIDSDFSSSYDLVLAKIIANKATIKYLMEQLKKMKNFSKNGISTDLQWTGSKVDLVELIYALQASGVVNNGEVNMAELSGALQHIFRIELGDIYRTFIEIRERKTAPTKFLDSLKRRLQQKMHAADA